MGIWGRALDIGSQNQPSMITMCPFFFTFNGISMGSISLVDISMDKSCPLFEIQRSVPIQKRWGRERTK